MADGIGRIFGGNNYGVGGFVPQKRNEETENSNQASVQHKAEETQVDPQKVMDFLANNNYFIPVTTETAPVVNSSAMDDDTQSRIASYMESFEKIFSIVEEDFPNNPEAVMDVVMDKLLGMV